MEKQIKAQEQKDVIEKNMHHSIRFANGLEIKIPSIGESNNTVGLSTTHLFQKM